jgi:hypothetical protein
VQIYIFWTGTNEMSENRLIGIKTLEEKAEVEVKLITPSNLNEYILKDFPLHPGYKYLSLVHKSDYLRCYFMFHYGGAYSDIKPCLMSWKKLFNELNASEDKWVLGPREIYSGGVPVIKGTIGADIKKYHNNLISNGAFIYKPNSPIAYEWLQEIHKRLDFFLSELKKCKVYEFGENGYPIPWAFIAGQIAHPLVLKYHERIICKDVQLFSIENYR